MRAPTGVLRMKSAKTSWSAMPQITTRHATFERFTLSSHAAPVSTRSPRIERRRGSSGVPSEPRGTLICGVDCTAAAAAAGARAASPLSDVHAPAEISRAVALQSTSSVGRGRFMKRDGVKAEGRRNIWRADAHHQPPRSSWSLASTTPLRLAATSFRFRKMKISSTPAVKPPTWAV